MPHNYTGGFSAIWSAQTKAKYQVTGGFNMP